MSVPSVENFCFFPSLPPAQGGKPLIRHRLPFLPLMSTSCPNRFLPLVVTFLSLTIKIDGREEGRGEDYEGKSLDVQADNLSKYVYWGLGNDLFVAERNLFLIFIWIHFGQLLDTF